MISLLSLPLNYISKYVQVIRTLVNTTPKGLFLIIKSYRSIDLADHQKLSNAVEIMENATQYVEQVFKIGMKFLRIFRVLQNLKIMLVL